MNLDFSGVIPSIPFILEGIKVTLAIVSMSILLGFVLGSILAVFKISDIKVLNFFASGYTSIFRGTPLILQLMIIYYGLPQTFGIDIQEFPAAILALGLNSAAYVSEIIRAGIQAVDKGQSEAAIALGVPKQLMLLDIIFPQAIRNILPALINEFTSLTKESAIVTVIGASDVMRRAYMVGSDTYLYMESLMIAGVFYYVLVSLLSFAGKKLEVKLQG
ncbi:MAG: polar amino acid transporter, inner rane subunit [Bacillales bacterium]|jgi:polar amino acid transport system permease protein|nr:polar amino acid transporter, inner rane subunit [Bacillales bacterium]